MGAQAEREAALSAGERLTIVADLEKSPVGDGEAEPAMFTGTVRQRATMGTGVAVVGILAVGDGLSNAFQPFGAALLHTLVCFTGFLAALLVDVVGSVDPLPICPSPGGDALVHGIGGVLAAALGQVRLPVEHVHGVVVGEVLLGDMVGDGPAAGRVAAQGKFQGSDHALMIYSLGKLRPRCLLAPAEFLFVNTL